MKDIPGYEGKYAASEDGKIWAYPHRWKITRGGIGGHDGKWLSPKIDSGGYKQLVLTLNGLEKTLRVHRLVALTYIPNSSNFGDVNHKNGVKVDNRVENLEWCTRKYNIRHSIEMGLKKKWSKLKESQVRDIKVSLKLGVRCSTLAHKYGVHPGTISAIKMGTNWSDIKV